MKYHFKIHKEAERFWSQCLEIPTCMTQGDSKEELFENMKIALNTYIEEPESVAYLAPLPDDSYKTRASIIEVPVDTAIAFGFMVRYYRIKQGMTQKEASQHLGMKNIFSYQRLERRCNATVEMIGKLLGLFPKLPLNIIFG